ncbi:MAG: serine/threonine-protein kinase [Myxococcota bacterium]
MSTPANTPTSPKRLEPGTLIKDRYRIDGFLGAGGFADVYRGEDTLIGRHVAIKILNIFASGASPEAQETTLKRFQQEAKAAALIKHPNAVTIYDFGSTDTGDPFMAMDLLNGHDLDHELEANGAMAPQRAAHLMLRCLEALAEAHRSGIVHKDLKPSNLFLTDPGEEYEQLVILDFGIAGITKGPDARRLTQAGQVLGTPQYMAPEYIEYQTIGPALDVYQMGLILAEMLTGDMVVDGSDLVTTIMTHTTGNLNIPPEVRSGPLGEVIMASLARKPEDRIPDAEALRRQLAGALGYSHTTLTGIPSPVRDVNINTPTSQPPVSPWETTAPVEVGDGPTTQPPPFTPPPTTPPPATTSPQPAAQSVYQTAPPQPAVKAPSPQGDGLLGSCLKALGVGAVFVSAVIICSIGLLIAFIVFLVWLANQGG